jgi:hypothetical protein
MIRFSVLHIFDNGQQLGFEHLVILRTPNQRLVIQIIGIEPAYRTPLFRIENIILIRLGFQQITEQLIDRELALDNHTLFGGTFLTKMHLGAFAFVYFRQMNCRLLIFANLTKHI